jgi:putative FmdB family regulatory protein
MPTYEYECLECKHRFEAFQSMKEEPLKECPKCHAEVKRLIGTGAGIIFKGSGFYVNDYKKDSSGNGKKSKGEPVSTSTGGAESSSKSESGKGDTSPSSSNASDVQSA